MSDELNRAKSLLNQVLGSALSSLGNNQSVNEAKTHIRKAIVKLDEAKSQVKRRTETAHPFGVAKEAGTATSKVAVSPVAMNRTLSELNKMIDEEKKFLTELQDKKLNRTTQRDGLISD